MTDSHTPPDHEARTQASKDTAAPNHEARAREAAETLRQTHRPCRPRTAKCDVCASCGYPWPCPVVVVCDALAAAEAEGRRAGLLEGAEHIESVLDKRFTFKDILERPQIPAGMAYAAQELRRLSSLSSRAEAGGGA